jgi:hypothetical protein
MNNWMLIAIVAAVAVVIYFIMRRRTLPVPPQPEPTPMPPAPGIRATSGQVPNNPPPAMPPDTPGPSVTARVRAAVRPTGQLQHIPLVGNVAMNVARAPINLSFKAADKVNSTLANIPVAGKVLAAPGKLATGALKSISSWF